LTEGVYYSACQHTATSIGFTLPTHAQAVSSLCLHKKETNQASQPPIRRFFNLIRRKKWQQ
jgi:hypothetical protein